MHTRDKTAWPWLCGELGRLECTLFTTQPWPSSANPLDLIVQGLDHAEWELAEGKMLDKQGQPVADPCAWVYRSLASQGY